MLATYLANVVLNAWSSGIIQFSSFMNLTADDKQFIDEALIISFYELIHDNKKFTV